MKKLAFFGILAMIVFLFVFVRDQKISTEEELLSQQNELLSQDNAMIRSILNHASIPPLKEDDPIVCNAEWTEGELIREENKILLQRNARWRRLLNERGKNVVKAEKAMWLADAEVTTPH
jgi:hypothetical protein